MVKKYLEGKAFDDVGELFCRAGKDMLVSAASSMGTLMAFGFMDVGKQFGGRTEIRYSELGTLLEAFENAVKKLGGAKFGRIAFKGEESRTILDPGSVLAALMIRTVAEVFLCSPET